MPFPRILRLQDDKWSNPEDSIGTFIGYLRGGRYRCWEAAGPARQAFRELSPDIKDFLETSSIPLLISCRGRSIWLGITKGTQHRSF